ncbi:D-alanine--D-alanyl carrier protein ligase [Streptomyces antimycoticus]
MLADASPEVVVSTGEVTAHLLERHSGQPRLARSAAEWIRLDDPAVRAAVAAADARAVTDTDRGRPLLPGHPAYVMYTSGSTGTQKGVTVPHHGVVNQLAWIQAEFQLRAEDRIVQKASFGFDASVWELFWPLLNGAGMVMARPGGHRDTAYLIELINRERVTVIQFVPSVLRAFLEDAAVEKCTSLRTVICIGEALPAPVRDRLPGDAGGAVAQPLRPHRSLGRRHLMAVRSGAGRRDGADRAAHLEHPGGTRSMEGSGLCRRAWRVSCTWPAPGWPGGIWGVRH